MNETHRSRKQRETRAAAHGQDHEEVRDVELAGEGELLNVPGQAHEAVRGTALERVVPNVHREEQSVLQRQQSRSRAARREEDNRSRCFTDDNFPALARYLFKRLSETRSDTLQDVLNTTIERSTVAAFDPGPLTNKERETSWCASTTTLHQPSSKRRVRESATCKDRHQCVLGGDFASHSRVGRRMCRSALHGRAGGKRRGRRHVRCRAGQKRGFRKRKRRLSQAPSSRPSGASTVRTRASGSPRCDCHEPTESSPSQLLDSTGSRLGLQRQDHEVRSLSARVASLAVAMAGEASSSQTSES